MRATRSAAYAFLSRSSLRQSNNMPCIQNIFAATTGNNKKNVISSPTASFSSSSSTASQENDLSSARGRNAVSLLPVYLTDARAVTKYHPTDSPEGALQLSVAENQMLEDLLVPALRKFSTQTSDQALEGLFHSDQIYYQPTHGREGLRKAMASYLQRILKLDKDLDLDGMVLGAGCNAVLENLCFCLTEPGDAVLLPTPYYAAFEFDLVARAALNIVPVNTMNFNTPQNDNEGGICQSMYYPNRESLDAAYEKALESGSTPKVLLLSHPNNPLGVCYPPEVVKECIDWAREKQVHLVSDEIYAGSVYQQSKENGEETFKSALSLASSGNDDVGLGLGPYIHFVYALSKDFALSGLRVGVAYSENEEIRLPMQKLNDLCQISSQTQLTVQEMLSSSSSTEVNDKWSTDSFLPENNSRIRARSEQLQSVLSECGIPYLKGDSGLFLWMDFSQFLPPLPSGESEGLLESPESMDARERELYLDLMQNFGLLFTPGRSMRNELPGFFRCVFTAASDNEFSLGLERIKTYVAAKKN